MTSLKRAAGLLALSVAVATALACTGGDDSLSEAPVAYDGPTYYGGPGIEGNITGFGFVGFWVPGTDGTDFPDGTGKLLSAGSRLGLQVHYNMDNADGTELDATTVELFLADTGSDTEPIGEIVLVAPVEVRCPDPYPDDPGDPCHRAYALEHSKLKLVAQAVHLPCGTRSDDYVLRPIGDGSGQETRCDQRVRRGMPSPWESSATCT